MLHLFRHHYGEWRLDKTGRALVDGTWMRMEVRRCGRCGESQSRTSAVPSGAEVDAERTEVIRLTLLAADLLTERDAARDQVERLLTEAELTRPIISTGRVWRAARLRDVPASVYLAACRAHVGALDAREALDAEVQSAAIPTAEEATTDVI